MGLCVLRDREQIERVLRRDVYANLYALGDLDDFFFPRTSWYGWMEGGQLEEIVLLYQTPELVILLAQAFYQERMLALLQALLPHLPDRFYAHLSPGLEVVFSSHYRLEEHGAHHKMALYDLNAVLGVDCDGVETLGVSDLAELRQFYTQSYPDHWFDPRMLETGAYMGLHIDQRLISVAGVHVCSPRYRVAALGNIATQPAWRGRGYGRMVTACLCRQLLRQVDHLGLNVKADNQPALRCYTGLGFVVKAEYAEWMLERKIA